MKKRNSILILAFLFLSLIIFLNQDFPPIEFLKRTIQNLFVTPKAFIYSLKTGKESLENVEIKKLKDENARLAQKLVELERLKRDNEALRSQFETENTKQYRLLPSRVIGFLGRFTNPITLIIDKGGQDRIKSGMAVVFGNYFVGRIDEVSPSYSRVTLPNNSNFSLVAVTSGGNVPGLIKGQDDFILFDRVAISEKVSDDETVLTRGEINEDGFGIPPNLVIGRIVSVNKNESLPYQSAKVESVLSVLRQDSVFIVLGL